MLVVGGGRAGLLAALGAAETGARVVLLEADATIGGGWRTERGRYHGGVSLGQLAEDARASGIEVLTGVQAVGWYDGLVTAIEADAHLEIEARRRHRGDRLVRAGAARPRRGPAGRHGGTDGHRARASGTGSCPVSASC